MTLNRLFFANLVFAPVVSLTSRGFYASLRELQRSQYAAAEAVDEQRLQKLRQLVGYAKRRVPHYRKSLADMDPEGMRSLACLTSFPTITKTDLIASPLSFRTEQWMPLLARKTTGGSTGEPVTIWKNREALAAELAAMWRGYSWAGVCIGDKQARFWGEPFAPKDRMRARLIDFVCNRKRFSAFAFTERDLERYMTLTLSYQPDYFYGYVSMLHEFASFFAESCGDRRLNLKAVIATSEVLHDAQRETITRAFNTKVYNEYGCGEIGTIGHECERGALHLSSENLIVEILNGDKPCQPEEVGELVITDLNNYAMPLIRYRLGDYAALSSDRCGCGRTLPAIRKLYGRAYDVITSKDGRKFHGEFFMYIMEEAKKLGLGIAKFQVVQQGPSSFLVKIIPKRGYGAETQQLISSRVKEFIGKDAEVRCQTVKEIPREKSGKMRLIVAEHNMSRISTANNR